MPGTARAVEAGTVFHVLNRANGRQRLVRKRADFAAFGQVLAEGSKRYPVDLLTYCLMGNHRHLVLQPRTDEALERPVRASERRRGYHSVALVGGPAESLGGGTERAAGQGRVGAVADQCESGSSVG